MIILPIDFHIFQRGRYTTNQINMFKLGKSFKSYIDPKKWWLIWGHPVQIILAQSPGTPQLENWWTPNTYSCGNAVICSICWGVTIWLLVWNHGIWWLSIYWEESSQLTNIFQRGWNHQPVKPLFQALSAGELKFFWLLAIGDLSENWAASRQPWNITRKNGNLSWSVDGDGMILEDIGIDIWLEHTHIYIY